MAVDVILKGSTVQIGVPRTLFQARPVTGAIMSRVYDVLRSL